MGELVPLKQKVDTIAKSLTSEAFIRQLKMALPKAGVTAERLARIAITELRRTPRLAECTPISVMGALMQCAQYGLEPGPAGLSWIIPRRNKGVWEANFQLGYKGLVQLLWNSGSVSWINAQCVRQHDYFNYSLGAPPRVDFRPNETGERGEVTHVFAAIGTTSGGMTLECWPVAQLDEHRERFVKAGEGSPWDTDWEIMARKTMLIQAAKFAPVSVEARNAIHKDELLDRGMSQGVEIEIDTSMFDSKPEDEEPAPKPDPELEGPEALLQLDAAISGRAEEFEKPAAAREQIKAALVREFGKLSELRGEKLKAAIKAAAIVKCDVK